MGDVKFVIIQKNSINYALLCDNIVNILFLEDIVSEINTHFVNYISKNNVNINIESVRDENLNEIIGRIIRDTNRNEFDLLKEEEIIEYLKTIKLNDEIEGIILLTDIGKIIF